MSVQFAAKQSQTANCSFSISSNFLTCRTRLIANQNMAPLITRLCLSEEEFLQRSLLTDRNSWLSILLSLHLIQTKTFIALQCTRTHCANVVTRFAALQLRQDNVS